MFAVVITKGMSMKIKELSREKLLDLVGLQKRNTARTWLGASGILGVGLVVGAGLAMLLTPLTGREVRDSISGGFRRVRRRASAISAVLPFVR